MITDNKQDIYIVWHGTKGGRNERKLGNKNNGIGGSFDIPEGLTVKSIYVFFSCNRVSLYCIGQPKEKL